MEDIESKPFSYLPLFHLTGKVADTLNLGRHVAPVVSLGFLGCFFFSEMKKNVALREGKRRERTGDC